MSWTVVMNITGEMKEGREPEAWHVRKTKTKEKPYLLKPEGDSISINLRKKKNFGCAV